MAAKANVLGILLTTDEGKEVLREYLEHGADKVAYKQPKVDRYGVIKPCYEKSAEALRLLESEFNRLLTAETQEVHDLKYFQARGATILR